MKNKSFIIDYEAYQGCVSICAAITKMIIKT